MRRCVAADYKKAINMQLADGDDETNDDESDDSTDDGDDSTDDGDDVAYFMVSAFSAAFLLISWTTTQPRGWTSQGWFHTVSASARSVLRDWQRRARLEPATHFDPAFHKRPPARPPTHRQLLGGAVGLLAVGFLAVGQGAVGFLAVGSFLAGVLGGGAGLIFAVVLLPVWLDSLVKRRRWQQRKVELQLQEEAADSNHHSPQAGPIQPPMSGTQSPLHGTSHPGAQSEPLPSGL